jgi:hypothetical protein
MRLGTLVTGIDGQTQILVDLAVVTQRRAMLACWCSATHAATVPLTKLQFRCSQCGTGRTDSWSRRGTIPQAW